jgi:hypothetical protein
MDNPAINFLIPEKRLPYPSESREGLASYAKTSRRYQFWFIVTLSCVIEYWNTSKPHPTDEVYLAVGRPWI